MTVASHTRRFWRAIGYRVKLGLLTLFGPATLDEEHDPIARLKREHQRELAGGPPTPSRG